MGNCVTFYKNKDPSDMDLSVPIQSPIKEKNVGTEPSIDGYDSRLPQLSSKEQETSFLDTGKTEESFFDSKPCLDSDCDDFFSVNGDSTSSTGNNSPNHQKSFRESSIPDTKKPIKQLIELFRESLTDDDDDDDQSLKETTPYKGYFPSKDEPDRSAQCCLPSLVRNMSSGERKKRLSMSPTLN